jgi:hypothetical protein
MNLKFVNMKLIKIASLAFAVCGLIIAFSTKSKKGIKDRIKLYTNNLSRELDNIDDSILKSETKNIDDLLNERGFLKVNFNSLSDNDKINYSIKHGYL